MYVYNILKLGKSHTVQYTAYNLDNRNINCTQKFNVKRLVILTSQDSQPTLGNIRPSENQIQNSHHLFSSMVELSMQQPPGATFADLASVLPWSRESERNEEHPGYHGSTISHLFSRGITMGGTTEYSIFNWRGCMVKNILFKALWWLQQFRGKLLTPKSKPLPQVQAVKSLKFYIITTNFNILLSQSRMNGTQKCCPDTCKHGKCPGCPNIVTEHKGIKNVKFGQFTIYKPCQQTKCTDQTWNIAKSKATIQLKQYIKLTAYG